MTKISIRELIKKTLILHSRIAVSGVVAPDDLERMRESLKSLVDALPHAVKTGDIPKGHGPTLDALIKVFMTMEPLYIRSLSVQALSHIAIKRRLFDFMEVDIQSISGMCPSEKRLVRCLTKNQEITVVQKIVRCFLAS